MAFTFHVKSGVVNSPDKSGELITRQSEGEYNAEPQEIDTVSGVFWIWGLRIGQITTSVICSPTGGDVSDFGVDWTPTINGPTGSTGIKTGAQIATTLENGAPMVAGQLSHTFYGSVAA